VSLPPEIERIVTPQLARLRHGLGIILLIGGVIHLCEMALASFYAMGKLRIMIPGRLWSEMYFAHFLYLVMAAMIYLVLGFKRTGVFYYEVLVDYLVALVVFIVLIGVMGYLLVNQKVGEWFSMLPGLFLVYYGLRLMWNLSFAFPLPRPPR
jgi:hypothetical protein